MRARGPAIVLGMLSLGGLAAISTCKQFSGDHPLSRQVTQTAPNEIRADFPASIQPHPGQRASYAPAPGGKVFEGRVRDTRSYGGNNVVTLRFANPIEPPGPRAGVSIDLSLPARNVRPLAGSQRSLGSPAKENNRDRTNEEVQIQGQ